MLGQLDLLAAEGGEGEVGDLEVDRGARTVGAGMGSFLWRRRVAAPGASDRTLSAAARVLTTDPAVPVARRPRRPPSRPAGTPDPAGRRAQPRRRFRSSSTGIGPGSTSCLRRRGAGSRVADEDQVEQLGERARRRRRATSSMPAHDLPHDLVVEVEAAGHRGCSRSWRRFTSVKHLPGDVTVLAPAAHLVVAQLGDDVGERRGLRVLVDLRLPAVPPTPPSAPPP